MTVSELIERLTKLSQDAIVVARLAPSTQPSWECIAEVEGVGRGTTNVVFIRGGLVGIHENVVEIF